MMNKKRIILILAALLMSVGVAMAEINVNTATEAELAGLPGIGEVKASAIVDYREANGDFASLQQLAGVDGIGEATVEGLQGKAGVGAAE